MKMLSRLQMETQKNKQKLLEMKDLDNYNMFNHLKACIKLYLCHQPDPWQHLFHRISDIAFIENKGGQSEEKIHPLAMAITTMDYKLLHTTDEPRETSYGDTSDARLLNLMDVAFNFNKCGIGLSEEEYIKLNLFIKLLVSKFNLENVRFWGKVFGLLQDYYIVETEMGIGEAPEVSDSEDEEKMNNDSNEYSEDETESMEEEKLPKPRWRPPPPTKMEDSGEGANKKIYFVCHFPGARWIRLPDVKPEHIVIARQIHQFFTGNLDNPIECCPPFPGTEANYLRAQIARISASTQISPEGYFQLGHENEEDTFDNDDNSEEHELSHECFQNAEYMPPPMKNLASPSLKHWVHHTPYILPQGRVTWWNPENEKSELSADEDEENEETKLVGLNIQGERGPPLLMKISDDYGVYGQAPWSARIFFNFMHEHASALVSSNLWPGAHAIAWETHFENIYIGWGLKATGPGFNPLKEIKPMEESKWSFEEATDPTVEEEETAAQNLLKNEDDEDVENDEDEFRD